MYRYYKNLQKNIDPLELIKKIRKFRKLNIRQMTYEEIQKALLDTLHFNGMFSFITYTCRYPKDTKFFRVRPLKSDILPSMTQSDFWNPPKNLITKYGRLNKPNESLLYTSPHDKFVAIDEMKLKQDSFFLLIVYKAKQDIKVNLIGADYDYKKLGIEDDKQKLVNETYNDFLKDEFSRDVGVGTEYLYKVSEIIAKDYFDLPPRLTQDAWGYPSVQNKSMYNVCFRPDIAKELLELEGAVIAKSITPDSIISKCLFFGFDTNGIAQFTSISPENEEYAYKLIS